MSNLMTIFKPCFIVPVIYLEFCLSPNYMVNWGLTVVSLKMPLVIKLFLDSPWHFLHIQEARRDPVCI